MIESDIRSPRPERGKSLHFGAWLVFLSNYQDPEGLDQYFVGGIIDADRTAWCYHMTFHSPEEALRWAINNQWKV